MKIMLPCIAALALMACTPADQPTPGFGDAVRHNIAAQVINPDPRPSDLPPPSYDGERTRGAIERYQTDKVKKPVTQDTTTVIKGATK